MPGSGGGRGRGQAPRPAPGSGPTVYRAAPTAPPAPAPAAAPAPAPTPAAAAPPPVALSTPGPPTGYYRRRSDPPPDSTETALLPRIAHPADGTATAPAVVVPGPPGPPPSGRAERRHRRKRGAAEPARRSLRRTTTAPPDSFPYRVARRLWRFGVPGWVRRRSLRARLTFVAALVLALGLTAGAVGFAHVIALSLTRAVDLASERRAEAVARDFDVSLFANPAASPLTLPDLGDGVLVQVVRSDGRVIAGTPDALTRPPLPHGPTTIQLRQPRDAYPIRIVSVQLPGGSVVAASSYRPVSQSSNVLVISLMLGVVILVGLGAAVSWGLMGVALRSVERMRRAAEAVTPGVSIRLPLPGASDEVRRLAETLNDMLDRLDRAASRQRRFVADAAHELRSPLAAARTELEVGLALRDPEQWPAVAEDVLTEVMRLGRLVEDLLTLAKVDDTGTFARAQQTQLNDLAVTAVERVRAGNPRVPVTVVGENRPLPVWAAADDLIRVARNLIDNAVRHAATRVVVEVRRRAEMVELEVRDDGPGVPDEARDRVFERFARLDDARSRDEGGSGLGLPIARELARANGGDVVLRHASPGARFILELPLAG
ncbi:MAG TPA: HAMP domain-containing sensor histidine kinase [Frankiaceae bacterium]